MCGVVRMDVLMTVVVFLETSADITISLVFSFHDLIRLALLARTRMLCFSNLNRDLRKLEW